MISDYIFIMQPEGAPTIQAYYVHEHNRRFKLVAVVYRLGDRVTHRSAKGYYERKLKLEHVKSALSYDALMTRARRAKTYNVTRYTVESKQAELDEIEAELLLEMI